MSTESGSSDPGKNNSSLTRWDNSLEMKKAGILAATSVAAAAVSTSSLSSGYDDEHRNVVPLSMIGSSSSSVKKAGTGSGGDGESGKFEPRFDGLRFIETLVTAHR
ncbi:hypothetical protein HPP92_014199 [Vanilla planifolia]|uniref:Uncharacterized protein n=1 Tax=Vanilla planifolia TaxID=51239 RepID=A0A835QTY8_VANPL|nr:hypothetical protein HPP92_014199 [Vanilla planifolia]